MAEDGDIVRGAEFSPDGTLIVTAGHDRIARIWNAVDGSMLGMLEGHTGSIGSAAFSPDGKRIVTGSADGTARVWDTAGRRVVATLSALKGNVSGVQFSPDGERIATANLDQTANIWDAEDGRLLTTLPGFGSEVRSATFSADGSRIVAASGDGTIRIWDVSRPTQDWDTLAADACTYLLSAASRKFSQLEIETDQLLGSEWPDASRDVCAGVQGTPTISDLYAAAGIERDARD